MAFVCESPQQVRIYVRVNENCLIIPDCLLSSVSFKSVSFNNAVLSTVWLQLPQLSVSFVVWTSLVTPSSALSMDESVEGFDGISCCLWSTQLLMMRNLTIFDRYHQCRLFVDLSPLPVICWTLWINEQGHSSQRTTKRVLDHSRSTLIWW